MTYPHQPPPPAPRQLRRSRNDRFLGGVCGGLADYLNMDPTLVRILTVVLSLFTGLPIVAYLVALFLMPADDRPPAGAVPPPTFPPYAAPRPVDDVWGSAGPPWEADRGTTGTTPPASESLRRPEPPTPR